MNSCYAFNALPAAVTSFGCQGIVSARNVHGERHHCRHPQNEILDFSAGQMGTAMVLIGLCSMLL